MKYNIFRHDSLGREAVKSGWSWPAFFFGWIWCITKELWVPLVMMLIAGLFMAILAGAGGAETGLIIFGLNLLAMIIMGATGNELQSANLKRKGYLLISTVEADSPVRALIQRADESKTRTSADATTTSRIPEYLSSVDVDVLSALVRFEGIQKLRDKCNTDGGISHATLNALGYKLLKEGNMASGREVFEIGVQCFEEKANAHASLGEALMQAGESARAVREYHIALNKLLNDRELSDDFRRNLLAHITKKLEELEA